MARLNIQCCYGCTAETGRHPGCHGACERYRKEKAELEASKAEKLEQKKGSLMAQEFLTENCLAAVRRFNKKTRRH